MVAPLVAAAENWERVARQMLEKAVAIPTVAGQGRVPELAGYLAKSLRESGFPEADIEIRLIDDTAVLVARYRGDGSLPPMLLNGHMDVVDADPADWERDPFTPVEDKGYLFGRGVGDNKFGMSILVTTLMRLKSEGFVPNRDIILVLTGDEESTMVSTRAVAGTFPGADFVLNADDVGGYLRADNTVISYGLQAAEKTYAVFELRVAGPGGHSSIPRPNDVIYTLAEALVRLRNYRFPAQANELTREYFRISAQQETGALAAAMRAFAADPGDAQATEVLYRNPATMRLTRTTCMPTLLRGGHAENALAHSAVATVNCRIFPGTSIESVRRTLVKVIDLPAVDVALVKADEVVATDASPLRQDIMEAVSKAVAANYPGTVVIPKMAAGASDCMWFRASGIPCYVTPGLYLREEDEFWHGLNERTPIAAIAPALKHWHILLTELAGPAAVPR